MTRFRDLLLENPDTVSYKRKLYSYTSPANRCAFFVYEDDKSGKKSIFGYSDNKKQFYSDDSDVLKDIKELEDDPEVKYDSNKREQLDYWAQKGIKRLKASSNGGGHLDLENILKGLGRMSQYADPLMKGRIFEVDDTDSKPPENLDLNLDLQIESTIPSGKAIIVTFWDSKRDRIIKYKDQYDKVIGFNGYDPKECLYEPSMKFYTYDEFYNNEEPKKETPRPAPKSFATDEADKFFKVGDKVRFKGMGIKAVVTAIKGNNLSLKVTDSDWNTTPVGSEFDYPYWGVDKLEQQPSLEKTIDDKTQEFVEKRGKLHSTGATFTPAEKQNLENEVDSLEIEIKILNDLLTSGEKYYTDNVKSVVATSVQRKLDAKQKEKQDRYSLIAQAEKQYGMPIAQIRQKYRNVPLDQLVKKESLYKKLLKALRG
jgi:hypothetical protein